LSKKELKSVMIFRKRYFYVFEFLA